MRKALEFILGTVLSAALIIGLAAILGLGFVLGGAGAAAIVSLF